MSGVLGEDRQLALQCGAKRSDLSPNAQQRISTRSSVLRGYSFGCTVTFRVVMSMLPPFVSQKCMKSKHT